LSKKYKNNKKVEFKEDDTKRVPPKLTQEIANPKNDTELVVYNNYYPNPSELLNEKSGGTGIKLYDKILQDSHSYSVLNTRWQSVVGKDWSIIPPENPNQKEEEISEFMNQTLYNTNFDFIRYKLLHSILYGYYGCEIIWKRDNNNYIVPDKFVDKHPRRFVFDENREPRLLTINNQIYGEKLPDKKFIIMKFGSIDNPYGEPLGQILYWPIWFKHTNIKFWLLFLEKYGSPTILGKFPQGTDSSTISDIQDVLNSVQKNTSIVLPQEMDISLLEATRSGIANYQDLCFYFDRQISKCVLGQVLTTESDGKGSYALGKIQNQVRQDILESDADLLDELLNGTLIKWIIDLNFNLPGDRLPKIITNTTPPVNLLEKSQIDKNLSEIGVKLTDNYFKKTYSLEDDDIMESQLMESQLVDQQEPDKL